MNKHRRRGLQLDALAEIMVSYVKEDSIYCQDNAMAALYSFGYAKSVLDAIFIINKCSNFQHQKRLTEGLLTFSGDHEELIEILWKNFDKFNLSIQIAILNYIRYKSSKYKIQSYTLLINAEVSCEIHFACIRYFGKYKYEPVKALLLELTLLDNIDYWEYSAICASALSNYPGEDTVETLKKALNSTNWYVRTNAAKSLNALNIDYSQLVQDLNINDCNTYEIMQYQLQHKKINVWKS